MRSRALLALALAGLALAAFAGDLGYWRSFDADGDYRIVTRFQNFNRDPLMLFFGLPRVVVASSVKEFGYDDRETRALAMSCGGPCSQADYDRKLVAHYRSRGFRPEVTVPGHIHLTVDIGAEVLRNRDRLRQVAYALDQMGTRQRYGADEVIGAAVAMVQTAIRYQKPPGREGDREILGFYPPPRSLEAGSGDCDTKSALLAAVLANFPGVRMVGVHIPGHYLVGIARVPRHGDAYVEFNGEPYVLIEAAGPAWLPPGIIGDATQSALRTMDGVRVEPLF